MSVNGQDYRSNVYLLDGTLQNDFTNGPAGSAAGTALGMESIREFRVETNAYSAEFGRNYGGQINVLTKSGTNSIRGSAYEFHRNDALDARELLRRRAASRTSRATSSAGRSAARCGRTACSTSSATRRCARTWARRSRASSLTTTRGSASFPTVRSPSTASSGRISTRSRAPTVRRSASGLASTPSSSTRSSIRTSSRDGWTISAAPAPAVRPLHLRRCGAAAADRLPAVPALVHLDEPVLHDRVPQRPLRPHAPDAAVRLQPHPHRPERRSEPRVAAAAIRHRARTGRRHRHRRHAAVRAADAPRTCGWRRTSTAASTT